MKVKIVKANLGSYWYANRIGQEFEVREYKTSYEVVNNQSLEYHCFDKDDVEIVPDFCLKSMPWKIRTGSKEKSELVQKFLFENGVYWINNEGKPTVYEQDEEFLTNVTSCGQVFEGEFMYSSVYCNIEDHPAQEIVIEYSTVIKNVVFPSTPMVRTEEQKQLDSLLEKIAELNKQAEELKVNMEGK